MKESLYPISLFYSGQVRDSKSTVAGAGSNVEEIDIFSDKDSFQAEQIMSDYALPTTTDVYAYCSGDDDTVYGYGKNTSNSYVRIVSVANGGSTDPGSLATLFTSTDSTNLAAVVSDLQFLRTTEASNPTSLYYIKGASSTWYIARYNIGAAAEQRWTGSAWSASGAWDSNSQLTGLSGSFDRPTMKVIFGSLYICHGRYVAKVDTDGTFTEKKFTLPNEWQAVDIVPMADIAVILCRNRDRNKNSTRLIQWDLSSTTQFIDYRDIKMGGAQWIVNHNGIYKIFCANNGVGRFYQLYGAAFGIPVPIPNIRLTNMGVETSTQPISAPKMVSEKEGILYFGLFKTDKSGIYAMGQLDADKPVAILLSKRFATTDYSAHKPYGVLIQGQNTYAAFLDNTTGKSSLCKGGNSPNRSSNAVWESPWIDFNSPYKRKSIPWILLMAKPLSASTDVDIYLATDYTESYTQVYRNDGTSFNTSGGTLAKFSTANVCSRIKAIKIKLALTSNTTNSPQVQAIAPFVQESAEVADD